MVDIKKMITDECELIEANIKTRHIQGQALMALYRKIEMAEAAEAEAEITLDNQIEETE